MHCQRNSISKHLALLGSAVLNFIFLAVGLVVSTPAQDSIDADFVLVGGAIHVGDGKPAIVGDVAIRDDRIVAVGKFKYGEIKNRIDCDGMIISPGFIDLHNHSDNPVTRKATRAVTNYLAQGCTTITTGNCGSGPIDVAGFYKTLEENGVGVNVAHLLPQGALRRAVMQTERRSATEKELAAMKELVDTAMQDGAWGMSTGLIYVPSSYADTKELIAVAKVVSQHGGIYVSHMRNEGTGLLTALDEALEIGNSAEIPVHVSHFKSSGKDSWGLVRVAVERIKKARASGQNVTADQYPYIASSTSLAATFVPTWARAGGRASFLKRLENKEDAKRIHAAIRKKLDLTDQGQRIQIAFYRPEPSWAGRRLKEIANERKVTPFELVLEIEKNSGASIVNYGINESDVRYVMQQPWVATASDGASRLPSGEMPHPRSYGTFPRKIGYYSVRENVISIEQAIRSSTGLPADILGLRDRGYLRVGSFADIAVWKEKELIDRATFKSPHQYSDGIRYLFVNGKPAIWMGDVTGALLGRPLRHPGGKSKQGRSNTKGAQNKSEKYILI